MLDVMCQMSDVGEMIADTGIVVMYMYLAVCCD